MRTFLRTFGHGGPTPPLLLQNDEARAMFVGFADRDYFEGEEFLATWPNVTAVPCGWADLSLATGPLVPNNNPTLVGVGCAPILQQINQVGTPTAMIPIRSGLSITEGEGLWLILATWSSPGFPPPQVYGAACPDPLRLTVAVQRAQGYRPMTTMGVPWVWNTQEPTIGLQAAVLQP